MFNVYCITDINNKKYVGITKRKLSVRLREHKYDLKFKNCSSNKIDLHNCQIELLEKTDDKNRESFWINKLDCVNTNKLDFDEEEYQKNYHKNLHKYKQSWGGDRRWNNNFLEIDVNLFLL